MSRARRRGLLGTLGVLLLVGLALWFRAAPPVLFINAHVLTLDGEGSVADTLLVVDGRIAALGTLAAPIPAASTRNARTIDLAGRTLMPGFVDGHSHFPAVDLARFGVDLAPPPDGDIDDIAGLLDRLDSSASTGWLLGLDYDESGLAEARHPTRWELDARFGDRPVWLRHRSGHMGVGNSAALQALGIADDWVAPAGGFVSRDADGRLDGLLQESAAPSLGRLLQHVPLRARLASLAHARDVYLRAGVTTVQNGHASAGLELLLAVATRVDLLPQSVVIWSADDHGTGPVDSALRTLAGWLARDDRFVQAAVKLILDGSPQGMTAWLSEPYAPTSGQAADYRGHPVLTREDLQRSVQAHHAAGRRLAIHTNGDAAIDAALDALEAALRAAPRDDHRHLLVHVQTARTDQLDRMAGLGVGASFFPGHVRYWGVWHRDVALGPARAARISPLAEADASGVRYSIHTDTPVTPMRPFEVLGAASNRRLPDEQVLGPALRVPRLRALRALTIDGAWQAGLEHDRGTLSVGKRADLLVISDDPLTIEDLSALRVDSVWTGGRLAYDRAKGSESDG